MSLSDKSVLMSCQISSSGWKLVPVEPTEEMLDSFYANVVVQMTGTVSNFKGGYQAMLAAAPDAPSAEPVAVVDANDDGYWADILPNRSVKVGQPLYAIPPDAAAEIARLRAEVERLTEQVRYRANSHEINCGLIAEKTATIAQQAERIAELDGAGERMSERIAELEASLEIEKGQCELREEENRILFARMEAQAAALAKAREALKVAVDTDQLQGGLWEDRAIEAIVAIDALKGNE